MPDIFLSATARLTPSNAVAAILVLDDGRYILQHRDPLPDIFYPDHWGFFGGGMEVGESELQSLVRELTEELKFTFDASTADYFTRFDFDFGFGNYPPVKRVYYEIPVRTAWLDRFRLGEGRRMQAFAGEAALSIPRLVPYDAYALWLHYHRGRFGR